MMYYFIPDTPLANSNSGFFFREIYCFFHQKRYFSVMDIAIGKIWWIQM